MSETLSLTKADLADIVSAAVKAAVAESKKEAPLTAKQEADIQQAQEYRKALGEDVIRGIEEQKAKQRMCSHEHSKKAGGGTHCVHVKESDPRSPGYILCQLCRVRVRPELEWMMALDPTAEYNNELFNRLFQDCADTGNILG